MRGKDLLILPLLLMVFFFREIASIEDINRTNFTFVKSLSQLFARFASFLFQITDIHVIAYETFI
jgi:hypothetical protein